MGVNLIFLLANFWVSIRRSTVGGTYFRTLLMVILKCKLKKFYAENSPLKSIAEIT